jgi:hypothetical protein
LAPQGHHLSFAHHWHGIEVEACEGFADRQPRLGEVTLDAAAVTVGNFVLGQHGQEASSRPAFLVGLRGELGPHGFNGRQAEFGEQEFDAGGIDGIGRFHAKPPSSARTAAGW